MKHATSIALYTYWQRSCGRTGVPAAEIRATELAPILPFLFLVDLDVAAGLRFRFCGASIAMRYGRDLTHESFLALWNAEDRERLERDMKVIAVRTAGMVAGVTAETVGGGFTSFEMLILPLSGDTGAAGAIGTMVRVGGHEEMNRIRARFVSQSIRSVRILPAAGRGSFSRAVDLVGPALRAAPSEARRQYRHLTVLPGGR